MSASSGPTIPDRCIAFLDDDFHKSSSAYAVLQNIKDDIEHRQCHDRKVQGLIALVAKYLDKLIKAESSITVHRILCR